ncbi:cytochrome C oxidase subunit IV family protein [Fulvivirga lutea]|uniref:Cytochrome C oxidase subunit IV family protein n=1 Tax=Fulvivirga lutea TaxID=2810512 RepID=A0A975A080_9BACT|nr:cytochrome C oxidase subunit IV family protein [Fulvivirga lutea]QSE97104.1 cytochrome C oxidase subunit IV family protein [Fulvivirga lutea]
MHTEETSNVQVIPADKEKIKLIWKTAGILALITALEFLVAFTVPHEMEMTRVVIFVGMTIVKAAYIVGEFMHLKYEVKVLIWSIIIPMIFVVWMLVAFVYEGGSIYADRF